MNNPAWLLKNVVIHVHEESISMFGGAPGIRDSGLLEASLARPKNKFLYDKADIFQLSSSYGYAFSKNHPFVDGNKRMSLITCSLFLQLNGYKLEASRKEKVEVFLKLAEGLIEEEELTRWIRKRSITQKETC